VATFEDDHDPGPGSPGPFLEPHEFRLKAEKFGLVDLFRELLCGLLVRLLPILTHRRIVLRARQSHRQHARQINDERRDPDALSSAPMSSVPDLYSARTPSDSWNRTARLDGVLVVSLPRADLPGLTCSAGMVAAAAITRCHANQNGERINPTMGVGRRTR